MGRVIKRIEFNSRSINFTGTAVFHSMGKYVTDFLSRFHAPGFVITSVTEEDQAQSESSDQVAAKAAHELECVVASLDAKGIPTEMAPGVPYTVHGRVLAALERQEQ